MSSPSIDITCDLGESFGIYKLGRDEEVIGFITSANVGCGFHGGDPSVMRETVRRAKEHRVAIGAHFGFPDLRGFGRRWITIDRADLINDILYQMGALQGICRAEGAEISHVKPHGATADMAANDPAMAEAIVEAVALFDESLPIYTVWNTAIRQAADTKGIPTVHEVYVDRAVDDDGVEIAGYDLTALGGSVNAALKRVVTAVKTGRLAASSGKLLDWTADSVCFHGDTDDALAYASRLNEDLQAAGFSIAAPEVSKAAALH